MGPGFLLQNERHVPEVIPVLQKALLIDLTSAIKAQILWLCVPCHHLLITLH